MKLATLDRTPVDVGVGLYIPLRSDETQCKGFDQLESSVFISHYVQMKRGEGVKFYKSSKLYIPLRSDETLRAIPGRHRPGDFISHYVQMKLRNSAVTCSATLSLYPTTFR